MKSKIYALLLSGLFPLAFAQTGNVGINTSTPAATLDVNGNMKVRVAPTVTSTSGYQILALNQNTGGDFEVSKMSMSTVNDGLINTTVYAAKQSTTGNLLNVGLLTSTFRAVNFTAGDRTVGNPALFTPGGAAGSASSYYTVPSTGVYSLNYNFRYDQGVRLSLSLFSGVPGIGIVRQTSAGTISVLENRAFSGANVTLLGVGLYITISESQISSLYQLNAGDRLYFGLTSSSIADLGALGGTTASFSIHKVSN